MPVATTAFDYGGLTVETTQTLRQTVATIREIQRSAIADVGNHLIAAKAMLEHGKFGSWAAAELGMTVRTAENYMNAAKFLADKAKCVSFLPPAILYKLSAPSAPVDIVEDVVAAAAAGAPLAANVIRGRLDDAAAQVRHKDTEIARIRRKSRSRNPLSREQAEQKLAQQRLDHKRWIAKQEKEKAERTALLAPLADRVAAALGDELADVVNVLSHVGRDEFILILASLDRRKRSEQWRQQDKGPAVYGTIGGHLSVVSDAST